MADRQDNQPRKLIYQRTNQPWKCGKIADGQPCPSGPTGRGECIHRDCKPTRRLFSVRRHIQFAIVASGLFIYVALLVSNYRQDAFAPGPLSLAHAQILQNSKNTERCAACHTAGQLNSLAWFSSPHPMTDSGKSQSQLCAECHIRDMPELSINNPHDLAIEKLRRESKPNAVTSSMGTKLVSTARVDLAIHDLACSDCHQEHRGSTAELQAITSQRCQSCHQSQFASFTKGHPEFKNYPYGRENRILFSHGSHQADHFPKKNATFECRNCHVDQQDTGVVGNIMRSLPFEQACASCHQQPLQNALSDGIVFFQVPSFDRKKLEDAGVELGLWPEDASQGFDGKIPPLMRLLLEKDDSLRDALGLIPPETDFSKLDLAKPETIQAIGKIAEGVRKLLKEIAVDGQQAIYARLNLDTDSRVSSDAQSLLAIGVPPDVFRRAYELWFVPAKELAVQLNSSNLAPVQLNPPQPPSIIVQPPALPDPRDRQAASNSQDIVLPQADDENDLLGNSDSNSPDSDPLLDAPANSKPLEENAWPPKTLQRKQLASGGWMVDENRKAITYIGIGHSDPWLTQWLPFAAATAPRAKGIASPGLPFTTTVTESQSQGEESSKLVPHPVAPPDSFLHPLQHGRCAECHRVDLLSSRSSTLGESTEMWRASRRPDTIRQITRFDHKPHLILGKLADCTACHRLSNSADTKIIPAGLSTNLSTRSNASVAPPHGHHRGNSEFEPMKLDNCSQCHRSGAAGDSCTQCHNYHVGPSGWDWDRRSEDYEYLREVANRLSPKNR
jgi:Cytochrome c554 and c-prime